MLSIAILNPTPNPLKPSVLHSVHAKMGISVYPRRMVSYMSAVGTNGD